MNPAMFQRGLAWAKANPIWIALPLALALRLVGIESRSLQYDDTFSIFLAARSLPEIFSGTAADTMPPLYYLLLHAWMRLGQSVWFIRLLSVLFSLAGIYLLYRLAECWLGRAAAGWSALLAAVSPLNIYHGQDVRMYALLVLAQLGYLWFFTRIWFKNRAGGATGWEWAGLVLCGAAAMYSHNVAIFALAVPDLFLFARRQWKLLVRLAAVQLMIGLLAFPWLIYLPSQIAKVQKAWTLPRPGLAELLQAVIMFTSSLPLPIPLLAVGLFLSLSILVVMMMELWRLRRGQETSLLFWLALLLMPPGLLLAASFVVKPMFIPRAFLVSSLAYAGLGGLVITRSWTRGVGKLLAGAFLLASVVSLPSYYTYNEFPRSPYRQAMEYLQQTAQPGDRIIHETKLSYFPAHFYTPDLPQVFLADLPGSPNDTLEPGSQKAMQIYPQKDLEEAIGSSGTVYFITYTQVLQEYQELGMDGDPNLSWLEEHLLLSGHKIFSDLEIYSFER
jgi:4-amino-4-deoxy-L-arabinose transferase-like glycosyltransferase